MQKKIEDRNAELELVALLKDRDARCFQCGYNLRNINGSRCPECGTYVSLDRLLYPPNRVTEFSWFLSFIGIAVNIRPGAEAWVALLAERGFRVDWGGPPWIALLACAAIGYALSVLPAIILLILFRYSFLRLPRAIRCSIVILIWLLAPLALLSLG